MSSTDDIYYLSLMSVSQVKPRIALPLIIGKHPEKRFTLFSDGGTERRTGYIECGHLLHACRIYRIIYLEYRHI